MKFTKEDRRILCELISNEQIHMIVKHPESYESKEYKELEELKVKVKNLIN